MKKYRIQLNSQLIGYTQFESADPPMGCVNGKVEFDPSIEPYAFFSKHCKANNLPVNEDDPDGKVIFTQTIPGLVAITPDGEAIEAVGAVIQGFEAEGYEIDVIGIPYPFYETEFPHHVESYENQYKDQ
jgi:hypothetical protein